MLASLKCGRGRRKFGSQKLGKEIEILSVNTILLAYRRCSIWPSSTSIHFVYSLIISCRTLGNIPSLSRMIPAATFIHATRSCCISLEWYLWQQMDWTWRPNSQVSSLIWNDMDFHFWGYMKTLVYETLEETQQDLVAWIQVAAGIICDMSGYEAIHKMYQSWWWSYWAPSAIE